MKLFFYPSITTSNNLTFYIYYENIMDIVILKKIKFK